MNIYLVGGAVRDQLLGLPVHERDYVVVGAKGEEMIAAGYQPVGKSFPVFLHPETQEEYALARIERKVGHGYHGFTFDVNQHVTLKEDLLRRDLTINAMAQDTEGSIIDPYGGQADLKARVLRHVSPAFIEDPLRVLRVARFAARFAHLGFTVAPETIQLMREIAHQGELEHLVSERVWKELERALRSESPWVFLQVLREAQALKVVLPEIDALYGVEQSIVHHPEIDAGIHIEMVQQQAAKLTKDPVIRFAALMHDVGKGLTPKDKWPDHAGHEYAGEKAVRALCARLNVPNEYEQLAFITAKYHGDAHAANEKDPHTILAVLEKCDAFRRPERFEQFLVACEADFRGRPGYEEKPYVKSEKFRHWLQAALKVDPSAVIASLPHHPSGEAIRAAISQARLEAIRSA